MIVEVRDLKNAEEEEKSGHAFQFSHGIVLKSMRGNISRVKSTV